MSGCFRMTAQAWNFTPNKRVVVTCEYRMSSTGQWLSDFGYDPPDLTTDSTGNAATGTTNNCVGKPTGNMEYSIVIDGLRSPVFG